MGEMLRLIFHNPGIIKLEEIGSRLVGIEEEEEAEEEVIEEVEEEEIGEKERWRKFLEEILRKLLFSFYFKENHKNQYIVLLKNLKPSYIKLKVFLLHLNLK